MTRITNRVTRGLAPALVMATLGAVTGGTTHELRSPDELDAARSLPPHQLAAVAEGMRNHPRSWDCALKRRSAR
jgi:hypothetical protein